MQQLALIGMAERRGFVVLEKGLDIVHAAALSPYPAPPMFDYHPSRHRVLSVCLISDVDFRGNLGKATQPRVHPRS
jgi:hypothetical protein